MNLHPSAYVHSTPFLVRPVHRECNPQCGRFSHCLMHLTECALAGLHTFGCKCACKEIIYASVKGCNARQQGMTPLDLHDIFSSSLKLKRSKETAYDWRTNSRHGVINSPASTN